MHVCGTVCCDWTSFVYLFQFQCDLLSIAILSRTPDLLLALVDGILALHHLKDSFSPNDSDAKQFKVYLNSLSSS